MKEIAAKYKYRILSVCSVITVLFIWEMATDILHLISPMMLPSPAKVLDTFVYKLTQLSLLASAPASFKKSTIRSAAMSGSSFNALQASTTQSIYF